MLNLGIKMIVQVGSYFPDLSICEGWEVPQLNLYNNRFKKTNLAPEDQTLVFVSLYGVVA